MKTNRFTLQHVFMASVPLAIALTYFRAAYFGGATYLPIPYPSEAVVYAAIGVSLILATLTGLAAFRTQSRMLFRISAFFLGIALILASIVGLAQLQHFFG